MSTEENKLDLPNFSVAPNVNPTIPNEVDTVETKLPVDDASPDVPADNQDDEQREPTVGETLYGLLKDEGVLSLPDDYEFDGEVSSLKTAFEKQNELYQQAIQEQFIQSVPKQLRDIYDAALKGVDNIDELLSLKRKQLDSVDITTLDNQRLVVKRDLEEKGINATVIDTVLDKLEKEGTLEAEAKTIDDRNKAAAQEQIKKMAAEKQAAIELQQKQAKEAQEQFALQVTESLKELDWGEGKKKSILSDLYEVDQTGMSRVGVKLNQIFQDPNALIYFADFLQYYDAKKGFDIAGFKQIESKEAEKVKNNWEEKLMTNVKTKQGTTEKPKFDISRISVAPVRK